LGPVALTLVGISGVGFLPIAYAKVVWVDIDFTKKYYYFEVCQITKDFRPQQRI
jgi:hypothetical protein